EGEVIVEASAAPAESRIAQGTRLLRAAVGSSSPQELRRARLAMRIGAATHYLAAGLACIWVFALGAGVSSATQRAMTLALLGAPTAWLLADRLVRGESLWNAFRRGVLIRDAAALADLAQVRIAAFDEAAV